MLGMDQALTHKQSFMEFKTVTGTDAQKAAVRLKFINLVTYEIQAIMRDAIVESPWELPSLESQELAIGMASDVMENLFYDVSKEDREVIESINDWESKEQREHENAEREIVRSF